MQSKYLIILISLLFISSIKAIDISILKGEKLFNQNTPIVVNIVSEEIQEKNSSSTKFNGTFRKFRSRRKNRKLLFMR